MEEDIKILEEIIKGDKECLEMDLKVNPNNTEDIEHWKKEIRAIENIVNAYFREKARADKLEKEYSKMLTQIDEYEVRNKELEEAINNFMKGKAYSTIQIEKINKNYIQKSKIKERMEVHKKYKQSYLKEYEKDLKENRDTTIYHDFAVKEQAKIDMCEELLEEE